MMGVLLAAPKRRMVSLTPASRLKKQEKEKLTSKLGF
jgi:hypothetical protein